MPRYHFGNGMYVGISAGAALPVQAIRNAYNPGVSVDVPIGWDAPLGPLGFRVDLGYTQFNARNAFRNTGLPTGSGSFGTSSVTTENPQVWSALANAKLRLPFIGRYLPGALSGLYAVGGGGVSYFRNYSTTFAMTNPELNAQTTGAQTSSSSTSSLTRGTLDAGAGLAWGFGASEVFLESRYVTMFTRNERASYVPIMLGVTFR
jgi:hypothetical protein